MLQKQKTKSNKRRSRIYLTRLNAALARKVQELQEVRSRFFEALRKALGDRADVKVVGDRFIFESDILFGSCSATIGAPGRAELDKLASALIDIRDDIPSEVIGCCVLMAMQMRHRLAPLADKSLTQTLTCQPSGQLPSYNICAVAVFQSVACSPPAPARRHRLFRAIQQPPCRKIVGSNSN